jgi:nucleotide-binding universal stress UspA family protein
MYRHVIVPFDGILEHRAVLAPGADLAWRCGAKVVIVATNDSTDPDIEAILKAQAMQRSGTDADFWVDLGIDIDGALLGAAAHRDDPVICITQRHRRPGLLKRRPSLTPVPARVLREAPCPVVFVGPEADVSRGLPFSTLYVPVEPEVGGEVAATLAAAWALTFRVAVHLVASVAPDAGPDVRASALDQARALLARVQAVTPEVRLDVIETERPAAALAAIAGDDPDGVVMLGGTGGDHHDALGPYAAEVVATSRRAVVFPPAS